MAPFMDADRFVHVEIEAAQDLWDWLAVHHAQRESVWLVTWKVQHTQRYVSREEVLDALIAYGWIDGRRLKLDNDRTMQLISPRKQHAWADSYKRRAARLETEGRMHPAGQAAVVAGQQSGLWHISDPIDGLIDPPDLTAALIAFGGDVWWQNAAPSYRRNVLRWIGSAKRSETRTLRISTAAALSAKGEKVPHY